MKALRTALTATWADGRPVEPGGDANAFLSSAAERVGEDPSELLRLATGNSAAGRIVLKLLGLTQEALAAVSRPPHRPSDRERAELILVAVSARREEGLSAAESYAAAPKLLADPRARATRGIGHSKREILGNGPTPKAMSPESVENAHRKAHEAAVHWYFDVIDGHEDTLAPEDGTSDKSPS